MTLILLAIDRNIVMTIVVTAIVIVPRTLIGIMSHQYSKSNKYPPPPPDFQ